MKIVWQIESEDITKVNEFVNLYRDNPFVQNRIKRNLSESKEDIVIDEFWHAMVACLLTTQQRSGPDSTVSKFILTDPFPLNYEACSRQNDLWNFSYNTLTEFGGIRRTKKLSDEIAENHSLLQQSGWHETQEILENLRRNSTPQLERSSAEFIDQKFKGFGPKQSRNLLQALALTRYEIPIDSRITKWLNAFGFPIKLTANALSDRNYYNFVMDGIKHLGSCIESVQLNN